jgi:hypothetical protein
MGCTEESKAKETFVDNNVKMVKLKEKYFFHLFHRNKATQLRGKTLTLRFNVGRYGIIWSLELSLNDASRDWDLSHGRDTFECIFQLGSTLFL